MQKSLIAAGLLLATALAVGPALAKAPDYKVVGHVAGPDGGWDYVDFDAAHHQVLLMKGSQVLVADVEAATPSTKLVTTTATRTHEAVPLDGDRILITSGGDNSALIVKAATGEVLAKLPTAAGPDGAIFDAKSGTAYVMGHGGGAVTIIDTKTLKVTGTVTVGGTLEFAALDGKGRLFVNVEDKNEIAVIDLKSKAVIGRYALDGCKGPTGLAYVPASGLLVSSCSGNAAVIQASDGKTVASLKIGTGPDAVIYDPQRKLVFIPCGGDGTLAIIDAENAKSVSVVQTVTTQRGARTGTVDPKTGKVYLATAKYAAPAGGGRAAMTPGSFELLVVGP